MPRMPRSDGTRAEGPGRSSRSGRPTLPQCPQPPRAYRRAGAWLAVFLGVWGAVAGVTLPNGLVLAAGLVVAALAVNRLGAEPRTAHRSKTAAPP